MRFAPVATALPGLALSAARAPGLRVARFTGGSSTRTGRVLGMR